ncbi:MAG: hypothetical protein QME51_01205 [Planctomycetota bacterium]|nr:hypothetical protein [Planctomycetota bacterium]
MKISYIKEFIVKYPEKVGFLVFLTIALVVLLMYVLGAKDDEMVVSVTKQASELKEIIRTNPHEHLERENYLKEIKSVWENIMPISEGKRWVMYRQPTISVKFEREIKGVVAKKINLPPLLKFTQTVSDEPDAINIIWDVHKDATASIKSFRIYRSARDNKDFALLVELQYSLITPTEKGYTYVDKGVKSETEYFYYVTTVSDDKDADKTESGSSGQMQVLTPADYDIKFIQVSDDLVYTEIRKYLNGRWEKDFYNIRKGDKIGRDKFVTGCTLIDMKPIEVDKLVGKTTMKVLTYEIIYLDRKGKQCRYTIPVQ